MNELPTVGFCVSNVGLPPEDMTCDMRLSQTCQPHSFCTLCQQPTSQGRSLLLHVGLLPIDHGSLGSFCGGLGIQTGLGLHLGPSLVTLNASSSLEPFRHEDLRNERPPRVVVASILWPLRGSGTCYNTQRVQVPHYQCIRSQQPQSIRPLSASSAIDISTLWGIGTN